jgi:hypothetical protein
VDHPDGVGQDEASLTPGLSATLPLGFVRIRH